MSSHASGIAVEAGVRLEVGGHRAALAPPTRGAAIEADLAARAVLALMTASARYWSGVAPVVREQMRHWHVRAQAIADPGLRSLALGKLAEEGLNAEVAAMLATRAPRARRRPVVKAIVALEVLYDYLDGLTEPPADSGDGALLYRAFTDALTPATERAGDYHRLGRRHDSGYLQELVATVRFALGGLPSTHAIAEELHACAVRGAEAQLALHAAATAGASRLRPWAISHALGSRLQWREYLAGAACSVLSAHALIVAAAARGTTAAHARVLDELYLSISVLPTLLDGAIDREQDARAGRLSCATLYRDRDELAHSLEAVAEEAVAMTRELRDGAHHLMTLAGVAAYYTDPGTSAEFARPAVARLQAQLRPLIAPTVAVIRTLRAASTPAGGWA